MKEKGRSARRAQRRERPPGKSRCAIRQGTARFPEGATCQRGPVADAEQGLQEPETAGLNKADDGTQQVSPRPRNHPLGSRKHSATNSTAERALQPECECHQPRGHLRPSRHTSAQSTAAVKEQLKRVWCQDPAQKEQEKPENMFIVPHAVLTPPSQKGNFSHGKRRETV